MSIGRETGLGVHPAPLGRNKKGGKIGLSETASESKNLWGLASSVSEEINSFASLEEFVLLKIYDATKAERVELKCHTHGSVNSAFMRLHRRQLECSKASIKRHYCRANQTENVAL